MDNLRIIGIDLAVSAKHKAVVFDPACNQFIGKQIVFQTRPDELERLLRRARLNAPPDVKLVAIMEATGMAWYPVAVYLQRQGVLVYRVNGQKTKDFRRVLWRHAGSDQIDCRVLAQLYLIARDRLEPCPIGVGDQLALQRACRAYDRWRKQDIAEQNRMKAVDRWAWGSLSKLIPASAQDWMRQNWYNPWRVVEVEEAALVAAWQTASGEATIATDWVAAWRIRARQMTELYGSEEMVGYDDLQAMMVRSLQLRAAYAQEQKRLFNEQIKPLYQKLYPDCPLTSLYGVGVESAATYRAFIQDINRFPAIEKFRLWCGIVPYSKQSGDSETKGLRITQAGPNLIKATLYRNADVARQWDVQLAYIYHRQMVEYGKHHLQAVCACASHLASRIYTVLKENRPYELRDLQNQPITVEKSRELCLTYRVPDEIRKRNNKRFRKAQAEQKTEKRFQQRQKRG